ncbi:MAG: gliding motility-associated C-terminal domain-containing protein [Cytophagales bacterium]|nr:gliding motility-associated C-terminal domain-containing protein [Cytophagales bacterium]
MIWHFGHNAKLDFNDVQPNGLPAHSNTSSLLTNEGSSGMTDLNGEDLFYTDGREVWDKNGDRMPNGFGLKGDASSTSSAIVVPKPGNPDRFYIFTVHNSLELTGGSFGYWYYEVDMTLNGGLGDVVNRTGTKLYDNNSANHPTEKIAVARHANGTDFWIIIAPRQWTTNIWAYQLSSTGLGAPVKSNPGGRVLTTLGYMKTNLESTKLAAAVNGGLSLFDFDNSTGRVTNPVSLGNFPFAYGIEFSPDGTVLYATQLSGPGKLFKFDLTTNPIASQKIGSNLAVYGALSIGPDERIYVAHSTVNGWGSTLGVMETPNLYGSPGYNRTRINFGQNAVFRGLPTFVPSLILPQCTPPADLVITSSDESPICGSEFDLTVSWIKEGGKSYNINWYKGQNDAGDDLGTTESIRITEIGRTYYTVVVTDADDATCSSTLTTTEEIVLANVPVFENDPIGPSSVCLNSIDTISIEHTEPTYVRWDISGNTGVDRTGVGEEIKGDIAYLYLEFTDNTTKSIDVFLKSPEGCESSETKTITIDVNNLPSTPTISGDNSVCEGDNETYSIQGGATSGSTYNWTYQHNNTSIVNVNNQNTLAIDFDGISSTPTVVTVSETDNNGCTTTTDATLDVAVNQNPSAVTINGVNEVCPGDNETFTIQGGANSGSTYSWSYTHDGGSAQNSTGTSLGVDFSGVTSTPTVITLTETITATGCSTETPANTSVTVNSQPSSPVITGDNAVCEGDNETYSIQGGANSGSTYSWSYTHDGSSTVNFTGTSLAIDFDGITTSPTVITLTEDNGDCTSEVGNFSVAVNQRPTGTAFTGDDDVCEGETVIYSVTSPNTGSTYDWTYTHKNQSVVNENDSETLSIDYTGVPNTPTTITLTETIDATGCELETDVELDVTVNQRPTTATILGVNDVCEGANETFTIQGGANTGSTYNWSYTNNLGTTNVTGDEVTINFSGVTTATTITLTEVIDATGCATASPATKSVTINPALPDVVFTGDDDVCEGDNETYTVTSANTASVYTWTYTHDGGSTVTSTGPSLSIDFAGISSTPTLVTVRERDANGCTTASTTDLSVTVNARPSATAFTGDNEVCEGETVVYSVTSPDNNSTYDWTYTHRNQSTVNENDSQTLSIDFTGISNTPTNITLTEENAAGCILENAIELDVVVNQNPSTATILGVNDVCEGANETFTIQGGANSGSTYTWSYSNNVETQNVNGDEVTIDFTGVTTATTITLSEEIDATGCTTTTPADKSVAINSRPATVVITGVDEICEGSSATFGIQGGANSGSTYSWSYSNNVETQNVNGDEVIIDFTGVTTATTITLSEEIDATGCITATPANKSIAINSRPGNVDITAVDQICENGSATLSITSPTTGSTYSWSVLLPNGTQTGTGTSIDVDFLNIKNQSITIEVIETNDDNCSSATPSTDAVFVQALPSQPSIDGDISFCLNDTGEFTATNVDASSSFKWTYLGNNLAAQTQTVNIPLDQVVANGVITVTEVTQGLGCESVSPATLNITVNNLPSTNDISIPAITCEDGEITVTATGGDANSSYTWDLGNVTSNITSASNQNSITFVLDGTTDDITVIETNSDNCSSTTAISELLTINSNPNTDANAITGDNNPECNDINVLYNVNGATSTSTYSWDITPNVALTESNNNATNDQVSIGVVDKQLTLTVTETTQFGCSAEIDNLVISPRSCGLVATISTNDLELCAGEEGTYLDFSTQNDAVADVTNWRVKDAGGTVIETLNDSEQLDYTFTTAGDYTVEMDIIEDGVTKTDIVSVKVNPNPSAFVINSLSGVDNVCIQTTDTFSVVDNGFDYVWSFSDAKRVAYESTNKDTVAYEFGDVGGTITVTAIDVTTSTETQCQAQATKVISLFDQPDTDVVVGDGGVCSADDEGVYTIQNPNPNSTYEWSWKNPAYTATITPNTNGSSVTIDFSTGQTNILNPVLLVSQTTDDGCTALVPDELELTVTLTPDAVQSITLDGTICDGDIKTVTANGGNGDYDYLWSSNKWNPTVDANGFVNFTTDSSNTIDVTFSLIDRQDTVTTFYVTQNNNGCIGDTIEAEFVAHPNPEEVAFTGVDAICSFVTENIAVTDVVGNTYDWFVGTNQIATGVESIDYDFESDAVTFTVVQTNQFGCTTSQDKTVTIKGQPEDFEIVPENSLLCSADSALFVINPSVASSTYDWTFTGNIDRVTNFSTSGDSVYVHFGTSTNNSEAGSLTVKQTNNDTGCETLDGEAVTLNINITTTPEILDTIIYTGAPYICDGSTMTFVAEGGNPAYDYLWGTDFTETTTLLNADDKANSVRGRLRLVTGIDTLTNIRVAQDNGGCIGDSLIIDFIINPNPTELVFNTDDSLCVQTSATITVNRLDETSTLSWKINNFTIPFSNTDQIDYFITNDVTFTITETDTLGCVTESVKNIYLKEQPDAFNILSNKPLLCSDDTTVLFYVDPNDVDSRSTYEWEFSGAIETLEGDGNDSVFVKFKDIILDSDAVLEVRETNRFGCTTLIDSTVVKVETINKTPNTLTGINFDGLPCDNEGGTFTANGGNGSYDYLWSTNDATLTLATDSLGTTFTGNPIDASYALNGSTDTLISVQVAQNNNGCIGDTINGQFTIHKTPTDVAIVGPDSVCRFSEGILSASRVNTTFKWTAENFSQDGDSITYNFDTTAVVFTLDQVNEFGCTSSQLDTVFIKDQPDAFTVNHQDLICSADSILFTIDASENNTYEWSFGEGAIKTINAINSAQDSVYVSFNNTGLDSVSAQLSVKAINENGCKTLDEDAAQVTFNVTTTPSQITSITYEDEICNLGEKQFEAVGGKANYEFLWSTDSTSTTTFVNAEDKSFQVLANFNLSTEVNDTLSNIKVAQNNNGCIGDTYDTLVTINALPIIPNIVGDTVLCVTYDVLTMSIDAPEEWTVEWGVVDKTLVDSSFVTRINVDTTDNAIQYIINDFNEYTQPTEFFVNVTDEKGCSPENTSIHTVNPDVAVQDLLADGLGIEGSNKICDVRDEREIWEFTFDPGIAIDAFNWTIKPHEVKETSGTVSIVNTNSDSTTVEVASTDGVGYFIIEVTPQNTSCKYEPEPIKKEFEIGQSKAISLTPSGDPICIGNESKTYAFIDIFNPDFTSVTGEEKQELLRSIDYYWSYTNADGELLAATNPNAEGVDTLVNDQVMIYQNAQKGDTVNLTINPNFCIEYIDGSTSLTETIAVNVIDYPVGGIDVGAVGTNEEDLEGKVTINDEGQFVIDDVISLQFTATGLEENNQNFEYTYQWSYYNPEVDSMQTELLKNGDQEVALYQKPLELEETEIQLAVSYADGYCTSYIPAVIFNKFLTWIPNTFSPNDDGQFDTWVIRNIEKYPNAQVQIFNRWGALVYEGPLTEEGWNGQRNNGDDLPMATYFYIIDFGSEELETGAGSVTIMR